MGCALLHGARMIIIRPPLLDLLIDEFLVECGCHVLDLLLELIVAIKYTFVKDYDVESRENQDCYTSQRLLILIIQCKVRNHANLVNDDHENQ